MIVNTILELLKADPQTASWVAYLESLGAPEFEVALPAVDALPGILLELAVPHEDIDDIVALLPRREHSPEMWWLLERCTRALVQTMGKMDGPPPFPTLPELVGTLGRFFYVYVFVATLPHTKTFHRERGISDEVSRLSLADLGRNMALYRRKFDEGGFNDPNWIMLHFRGLLYALGRLQFERSKLGNRTGRAVTAAGLPYGPGDPALSVHIPAFYGPMTPESCDASFARAKEFFARHFPETTYAIGTCHSWLLDEQLAEYLPEHSNIIRFQQRFQQAYRLDDDDEAIMHFVFRRTLHDLAEVPQRNSLERAVVTHIRSGRHWRGGAGWLELGRT